MSTPERKPGRHEVIFSMADASKDKVNLLLRQCGHSNLNLLIARGLALVEWVEEQTALGRTVASIRYCTDDGEGELDVAELFERQELLKPRPRPVLVPQADRQVSVSAAEPAPVITAPVPAPEPEPITVSEPIHGLDPVAKQEALNALKAANPKLMARPKMPIAQIPQRQDRLRNSRAEIAMAHKVNDSAGPIKSFECVRAAAFTRKRQAPICFRDLPLPGELRRTHLEHLETAANADSRVSHFQIDEYGDLLFYAFLVGKGWCFLEVGTMAFYPDMHVDNGTAYIFPVALAVDYLNEYSVGKPPLAPRQEFDTGVPNF